MSEGVRGLYLFPNNVLESRGYLAESDGTGGRLTLSLSSSFVEPESDRTRATQAWQLPYYVDLHRTLTESVNKVRCLLGPRQILDDFL